MKWIADGRVVIVQVELDQHVVGFVVFYSSR
jgi:hypothetical protein